MPSQKSVPDKPNRTDRIRPRRIVSEKTRVVSSVSPFPAARVHSAVAPTIRTPLRMEARLKYGPPIPKAASAVGPRNAPVSTPSMTAVTAPESSATSIVSMVFWNSFRRMYSSLTRSIGAPFKSSLAMHTVP